MRYVAAYLLAALGGNESPAAADIKAILSSVGIEAEDDKLNTVSRGIHMVELRNRKPQRLRSAMLPCHTANRLGEERAWKQRRAFLEWCRLSSKRAL